MASLSHLCKAFMLLACVRTAITQPLQSPDLDGLPFQPTYLFTANVSLGLPPQEIGKSPITIPGGVIVPEQILGGTISGPFLNATIVTGLATPQVYLNGTLQQPVINLYGVTTDGHPFSLHEEGIGSPNAQVTRINIQIGGGERYDEIRNGYIMATVNPNAERTMVDVRGYLIENTVTQ